MTKIVCAKCGGRAQALRDDPERLVCYECSMFIENCRCSGNVKLEKWVDIEVEIPNLDDAIIEKYETTKREIESIGLLDRAILAARQETKKR